MSVTSTRRRLSLAVLTVSVILPSVAVVARADDSTIDALPRLAGTTTITATHSGTFDLVIPQSAYLSATRTSALDVVGAGRYVQLTLTERSGAGSDVLTYARYPKPFGESFTGPYAGTHQQCLPDVPTLIVPLVGDITCGQMGNGLLRLHPGLYTAEVVVDSSPITFRLHSTSLTGAVEMAPTERIYSTQDDIADQVGLPVAAAGGAGDDVALSRRTVHFYWWKELPGTASTVVYCENGIADDVAFALPDPSVRWVPTCPASGQVVTAPDPMLVLNPDDGIRGTWQYRTGGPGPHAMGIAVAAAGLSGFTGLAVVVQTPSR